MAASPPNPNAYRIHPRLALQARAGTSDEPANASATGTDAADKAVARKILDGLPDVPRAKVARNPANSSEHSSLAQATRARALRSGYERPKGFWALMEALLPFAFKRERTPAFERLDQPARTKFLAVAHEADAQGQIALHSLLVAGKLPPALLDQVHQLATMTVDKDVDRRLLLSQALVELHDPTTVSQASRGTCAATSIQILIAITQPALYVELLRGLASPGGRAKLPGGETISREPDWAYGGDGGRSIPSRLFQPAFMELGNGELDYDNKLDADVDPKTGQSRISGLEASQAGQILVELEATKPTYELLSPTYHPELPEATARALDNHIGGPNDWLMLVQNPKAIDPASQAAIVDKLAKTATPATPVYATIVFAPDKTRDRTVFHAVLVTAVANGQVTYINPWGQEESLSIDTFKRSVVNLVSKA